MPNTRKMNDNEKGRREREKGRVRTQKLILDQNKKNMIKWFIIECKSFMLRSVQM